MTVNPISKSDNSGSLTRGGINPTAVAMVVLYEVMVMYAKITGINAEQQQAEIKAQKTEGSADGQAIKEAGAAMKKSLIWAGALGIAGAGTSLIFTGVGTKAEGNAAKETGEVEAKAAPMKQVSTMDDNLGSVESGTESQENDSATDKRAKELKQGIYEGTSEELTENALKTLRNDPKEYEKFRTRLDDKMNTHERAVQNKAMGGQNAFQRWNMVGQSLQGATGGGGQMAQGYGQAAQAKHNAASALQKSALGMAQSSASSLQQAQSKSGEAQNNAVNVINAIRQTSSNV